MVINPIVVGLHTHYNEDSPPQKKGGMTIDHPTNFNQLIDSTLVTQPWSFWFSLGPSEALQCFGSDECLIASKVPRDGTPKRLDSQTAMGLPGFRKARGTLRGVDSLHKSRSWDLGGDVC